jgi:DDE superfamily endonuclease
MSERVPAPPAPGPLENYAPLFDPLFSDVAQRRGLREYLQGLLLPRDRNKTLTGVAGAEPNTQAQAAPVQSLQFFLSESTWDVEQVTQQRLALLFTDPATRPHEHGVFIIDETGDRKLGTKTAHVARQYLGSVGKVDNGSVAVTSLWADERLYFPLHVEPYEPAGRLPKGKKDPAFRTKPQIGMALVDAAWALAFPSARSSPTAPRARARPLRARCGKPACPTWWRSSPRKARARPKKSPTPPRQPHRNCAGTDATIPRIGPRWSGGSVTGIPRPGGRPNSRKVGYGPDKPTRRVVATTDPAELPEVSPWYLATNLPRPGSLQADEGAVPPADLAEVVRLYGRRNWVEQSYKQAKSAHEPATQSQKRERVSPAESWDDGVDPKRPIPQAEEAAGGKGEAAAPTSPPSGEPEAMSCWPVPLRRVRSWLWLWHILWRCWRAWSEAPPPPPLQALLDAVAMGRPLNLYLRC